LIDSHTHLDACEAPDAELVHAAQAAGVVRLLTVGTDPESCRAAIAAAERFPSVYAAIGCHPNVAQQLDLGLLRELAAHPRCVAIGETGLDYYRDRAPRELQLRAFEAQIELARELDKPLVIHTRAAAEDTLAVLRSGASGLRVIMHCFSMPEHLADCIEAGGGRRGRPAGAPAGRNRRALSRAPLPAGKAERAGRGRRDRPLRGCAAGCRGG